MGYFIAVAFVTVLAVVTGFFWIRYHIEEDYSSLFGVIWRGLLVIVVAFLVVDCTKFMVAYNSQDIRTVSVQTIKVKSLGNSSNQSGEYYIVFGTGHGSSETKKVINYIRVNDDGSFSLAEIDADKATIREVVGEKNPHLLITKKQKFVESFSKQPLEEFELHEFVVPEGTIGNNFSIDVNR